MDNEWIIETLKLMSHPGRGGGGADCLGVKDEPY